MHRRQPKVLLYHACEESESDFTRGLRSNTPPRTFAMHLDFLREHYRVVPIDALAHDAPPERAVAVTFDDGYRSVYEAARPLLAERRLPATVYLIADVIDNPRLVWVNELNWLLRRHADIALPIAARMLGAGPDATPELVMEHAILHYDPDLIARTLTELRGATGVDARALAADTRLYLTRAQIAEMRAQGFTFGNHTASHPNLARLGEPAQREELARGRSAVAELLGECDSAAYPFGYFDDTSRRLGAELGHRTLLEVGGVNAPFDPLRLRRVVVSARTPAELFAEIEVVTPLKARLLRILGRG
jgi:peptidoglycan/xylan/chitin deacetylase (PgdA/CDA1 family)